MESAIFPCLDQGNIFFLKTDSRDSALEIMIDKIDPKFFDGDKKEFLKAILSREELVSTGVGLGCAIPHAKLHGIKDFFLAIGIIAGDGIDWKSIDRVPVKLIFMIGGPNQEANKYLKILSALTEAIRHVEFRAKLLSCQRPQEVIKLFEHI